MFTSIIHTTVTLFSGPPIARKISKNVEGYRVNLMRTGGGVLTPSPPPPPVVVGA